MSQKEKLINRLKKKSKDFTFDFTVVRGGKIDMNNIMRYKDYVGSVEFSEEDHCFFGSVLGIRSLISYEGTDARGLVEDFHNAVDSYLTMCEEKGEAPEKAYKGTFNVRVPAELHREAVLYGISHDMSLNKVVEEALQRMLGSKMYSGASLLCEETFDSYYNKNAD